MLPDTANILPTLSAAGLVMLGAVSTAVFQGLAARWARHTAQREARDNRIDERLSELVENQAKQGTALAELRGIVLGPPVHQGHHRHSTEEP
jgi:hypothetical protein